MVKTILPKPLAGYGKYRARRPHHRDSGLLCDVLLCCVVLGLICMIISDVNYQRSTSVNPVLILPPALSAALARASLGLLLTAALGGVFLLPDRTLPGRYTVLWGAFCLYSAYLAVKGLGFGGLATSRVFAELAPGAAVTSGLIFVGASRSCWPAIVKLLRYVAFAAALLVCVEIGRLGMASRPEAYARYFTYEIILEACALIPVGYDAVTLGRVRYVSWFPFLALGLAAVVMQTRLILVVMLSSAGLMFFLAGRNRRRITGALSVLLLSCGVLILLFLMFDSGIVTESARQFWARRLDDTRSGQAKAFFNRVSIKELLAGVGIPPEGAPTGEGADGIDLGYVNIAYFGGLPAVVLFVFLHLTAALRCVHKRLDPLDAVCVASVLTYGLRLFSSTVPALRPHYIIVLFLMGRCAAIASNHLKHEHYPSL